MCQSVILEISGSSGTSEARYLVLMAELLSGLWHSDDAYLLSLSRYKVDIVQGQAAEYLLCAWSMVGVKRVFHVRVKILEVKKPCDR